MLYKEYHALGFKYIIPFEISYNKPDINIIAVNSTWIYYFKVKIYKNLYIVSNGNWFYNLNLAIK